MSHLGDLLSALVDGELSGSELDRANAHLAACPCCQAEATGLRVLKQQLHELAEIADADGLTRRLLAMALADEHGEPDQRDRQTLAGEQDRPGWPGESASKSERENERGEPGGRRRYGRPGGSVRPGPAGPYSSRPPGRSGRRGRYVLWGTVSLVVVGIGTAAFSMGGGEASPGPQITPPAEMYDVQHALTSGDVPFSGPVRRAALVPTAMARP